MVGGLVGIAVVISGLTFLYWRHTRPLADDFDSYGEPLDPTDGVPGPGSLVGAAAAVGSDTGDSAAGAGAGAGVGVPTGASASVEDKPTAMAASPGTAAMVPVGRPEMTPSGGSTAGLDHPAEPDDLVPSAGEPPSPEPTAVSRPVDAAPDPAAVGVDGSSGALEPTLVAEPSDPRADRAPTPSAAVPPPADPLPPPADPLPPPYTEPPAPPVADLPPPPAAGEVTRPRPTPSGFTILGPVRPSSPDEPGSGSAGNDPSGTPVEVDADPVPIVTVEDLEREHRFDQATDRRFETTDDQDDRS